MDTAPEPPYGLPCMRPREILPGILHWTWFSERHGYDFNGYLLRDPGGNIVIDPVEVDDETLGVLAAEGVSRIVLTNRNHTRACVAVRERTGARVAIHPADAAHARQQGVVIDDDLAVGDRVGPLCVLPATGKSPGEIALLHPERRILWLGDLCVGKPPGECALLPDSVMDQPDTLRQSVRNLVTATDFDAILFGDGAPILTGGRDALRRLVATL
jgi:glyoxylase-like metal-dependent hydrolase (beta-lactamase superfamily II)